jgi:8-oxo-dGTP pyrophosphatase MutT (NUDIX family)
MQRVAKALIYNSDGQLLILRRSDTHPHFALHDDLPGGTIDTNETPLAGVVREVYEETGLHTRTSDYSLVYEWKPRPECHDLLYALTIPGAQPELSISWEHDKASWIDVALFLSLPQPDQIDEYFEGVLNYLRTAAS